MLGLPGDAIAFDIETRSRADLRRVGGRVYAEHASTELLGAGWLVDGVAFVWSPVAKLELTPAAITPPDHAAIPPLRDVVLHEGPTAPPWLAELCGRAWVAHNAQGFDAPVWRALGLPEPAAWLDSLPWCSAFGLPRGLEQLGEALFGVGKDSGAATLLKLSQPAASGKMKGRFLPLTRMNVPAVLRYMIRDVQLLDRALDTLRALVERWGAAELAVVEADAAINDTGIAFDAHLARRVAAMELRLRDHTAEELHGIVGAVLGLADAEAVRALLRSVPRLLEALAELGVHAPDAKRKTLQSLLPEVGPDAQAVILARIGETRITSAKLQRGLEQVNADGLLRGTVAYHAAHTGRWGGRGMQLQNLPRPNKKVDADALADALRGDGEDSPLLSVEEFFARLPRGVSPSDALAALVRACLLAEPGTLLCVADYSNIEARVLLWLVGDEPGLRVFWQGGDPYVAFASKLFSVPEAEVTGEQRSAAKVAVLGCLDESTEVLTLRGWVKIPLVKDGDFVYDGLEWVRCDGVAYKGVKPCIKTRPGVLATPDHLFLMTSGRWMASQHAEEVQSPYWTLETLPEVGRSSVTPEKSGLGTSCTTSPGAIAERMGSLNRGTYAEGSHGGATRALRRKRGVRIASWRPNTAPACSNGRGKRSGGVPILSAGHGHIMEGAGSSSVSRRSKRRSSTCSHFRGMTTLCWRSIASTMTGITSPATSVLLRAASNAKTGGTTCNPVSKAAVTRSLASLSKMCLTYENVVRGENRSPASPVTTAAAARTSASLFVAKPGRTYDVLNAGPRARFVCRAGPGAPAVIAHNCGYGLGMDRMGAYAAGMGVDLAAAGMTPATLIEGWRDANPLVAGERTGREWQGVAVRRGGAWRDMQAAFVRAIECGESSELLRCRVERWHEHVVILLPSGRPLLYRHARMLERARFGKVAPAPCYTQQRGRTAVVVDTYGGKAIENCVQAIARDCLAAALVRLRDAVRLHVHDELIAQAPERVAEQALRAMLRAMTLLPSWAAGLPLAAEGFVCRRYAKRSGTHAALCGQEIPV